jgi:dihydroorotate dehydrogenase electron transfer subunit
MLSALASVAAERELKCFVSLETHMACGIGACLGCAVKMKGQKTGIMPVHKNEGAISQRAAFEELGALNTEYVYRRACKEGPVFEASDVVW